MEKIGHVIKIIGVGGCGGNMVNYVSSQQEKMALPIELIAIDDDMRAIHKLANQQVDIKTLLLK